MTPDRAVQLAAAKYAASFPGRQRYSRFIASSLWRPFSQPPQDWPLAVCDGTSVSRMLKRDQCDSRDTFEECGMRGQFARRHQRLDTCAHPRPRGREIFVTDFLAINANPFVDAFEMW